MKTLVSANQKGGVGKTAFIVNLARHLEQIGCRTVVIDLDFQGNAALSLSAYKAKKIASHVIFEESNDDYPIEDMEKKLLLLPESTLLLSVKDMNIEFASKRMKASLDKFKKAGFDFCLIDTPPELGKVLSAALSCADFVISPIELELYSLAGIHKMVRLINGITKKHNPKLINLGMLPSRVDTRSLRQKKNLLQLQNNEQYSELLIPSIIKQRSSFAEALATKKAIWEIDQSTAKVAAKEIKATNDLIISLMLK